MIGVFAVNARAEVVGYISSGAFSQSLGTSIGLCFISTLDGLASLLDGAYSVMVEGQQIPATLNTKPFLA